MRARFWEGSRAAKVGACMFIFAVVTLAAGAFPGIASSSPRPGPEAWVQSAPAYHPQGSVSSLNWAGYAVAGKAGSVTDVRGSWIVPRLTCSSATTYSALWIGIDGFNSGTVEQVGIMARCQGGLPAYYGWYEFYPSPMYRIVSLRVAPENRVEAEVAYIGAGAFRLTISSSGGGSFSLTQAVAGASRSSAEWVVERPSICSATGCYLSTLSNTGTNYYGLQYTGISSTGAATISGKSGSMTSFQGVTPITMTDAARVLARPSVSSSGGSSFYVTG